VSSPRTISGGVLLGDTSGFDKPGKDGLSETYACSQGFSGVYQVFVQRVWGDVNNGTVTIDIVTDFGTKDQQHIRKQIPLSEKNAMVQVDVKNGRREANLADIQISKTQTERLAAARSVLAQQAGDTSGSQGTYFPFPGYGTGGVILPVNPFRRGAVGYQPNITVLPEGTFMFVRSAVITGDRRYVRVTPMPNFNAIRDVTTFNFITGQGSTGGGGGGGTQ
jgi:hypothetical protein